MMQSDALPRNARAGAASPGTAALRQGSRDATGSDAPSVLHDAGRNAARASARRRRTFPALRQILEGPSIHSIARTGVPSTRSRPWTLTIPGWSSAAAASSSRSKRSLASGGAKAPARRRLSASSAPETVCRAR